MASVARTCTIGMCDMREGVYFGMCNKHGHELWACFKCEKKLAKEGVQMKGSKRLCHCPSCSPSCKSFVDFKEIFSLRTRSLPAVPDLSSVPATPTDDERPAHLHSDAALEILEGKNKQQEAQRGRQKKRISKPKLSVAVDTELLPTVAEDERSAKSPQLPAEPYLARIQRRSGYVRSGRMEGPSGLPSGAVDIAYTQYLRDLDHIAISQLGFMRNSNTSITSKESAEQKEMMTTLMTTLVMTLMSIPVMTLMTTPLMMTMIVGSDTTENAELGSDTIAQSEEECEKDRLISEVEMCYDDHLASLEQEEQCV